MERGTLWKTNYGPLTGLTYSLIFIKKQTRTHEHTRTIRTPFILKLPRYLVVFAKGGRSKSRLLVL